MARQEPKRYQRAANKENCYWKPKFYNCSSCLKSLSSFFRVHGSKHQNKTPQTCFEIQKKTRIRKPWKRIKARNNSYCKWEATHLAVLGLTTEKKEASRASDICFLDDLLVSSCSPRREDHKGMKKPLDGSLAGHRRCPKARCVFRPRENAVAERKGRKNLGFVINP